jgi:tetratricopeptide (TPR) repeat protein
VIVPIPANPSGASAEAKPPTPVVDTTGAGGRKPVIAPIGPAREDVDERGADPRMARERASETRPLLYVCRLAFDQRRYKDAEGACTAARDANAESADAHALLAHALFNRNKKREALTSAERAAKLNPKLAQMYVIIGGVRQEDGDLEEARRAYERYLELEPKGSYAAELKAIISRLPAKL